MFLNVNTLSRFGIYSSLMTGNILDATLALKDGEYKVTLFKFAVILCHSVGGTSMNCYLMEYFKSREHTFGMIMLWLIIACVLVDLMYMDKKTDNHYVVCLLTIVCGALAHWSSKLGYVVMLHTGNMFKLAEALWLFLNGYAVGGAKMRGDAVMLLCLILSSLGGAVLASLSLVYAPRASLIPVLATVPMHLHLSGTTAVWGFPLYSITDYLFSRNIRRALSYMSRDHSGQNPKVLALAGINSGGSPNATTGTPLSTIRERDTESSQIQDDTDVTTPRASGFTPRTTRKAWSYSIFERVEITPEELAEFEATINSHQHRSQVNMS